MFSLKVTSIQILTSSHTCDTVILNTDITEGTWPYKANAHFLSKVASEQGEEWVKKNFPGVSYTITVLA